MYFLKVKRGWLCSSMFCVSLFLRRRGFMFRGFVFRSFVFAGLGFTILNSSGVCVYGFCVFKVDRVRTPCEILCYMKFSNLCFNFRRRASTYAETPSEQLVLAGCRPIQSLFYALQSYI